MNKKSLLIALILLVVASTLVFAASVSRDGVTITYTPSTTELTLFELYNSRDYGVWVTFTVEYSNNSRSVPNQVYVGSKQSSVTGFQPYPVRSISITSVERSQY
jgi:P pilus assembly chaperone PapD